MAKCRDCDHNLVCIYIWQFHFKGATCGPKELRDRPDIDCDKSCGHFTPSSGETVWIANERQLVRR